MIFSACYSTSEDINCRANNSGNANDKIFYFGDCRTIYDICGNRSLSGVNVTFCRNETAQVYLPINDVINRTLSSEEFF